MPLYEYSCTKCHKNLEVMQKLAEAPLKKCPSCGGKLVKNLSATSFQLKGGGWYKDGYSSAVGSKTSEGASKTDSAAKMESSKPESGKSESTKSESSKPESGKTAKEKN